MLERHGVARETAANSWDVGCLTNRQFSVNSRAGEGQSVATLLSKMFILVFFFPPQLCFACTTPMGTALWTVR